MTGAGRKKDKRRPREKSHRGNIFVPGPIHPAGETGLDVPLWEEIERDTFMRNVPNKTDAEIDSSRSRVGYTHRQNYVVGIRS
jgi:hypothetical protein